jgi:hypothetical protein
MVANSNNSMNNSGVANISPNVISVEQNSESSSLTDDVYDTNNNNTNANWKTNMFKDAEKMGSTFHTSKKIVRPREMEEQEQEVRRGVVGRELQNQGSRESDESSLSQRQRWKSQPPLHVQRQRSQSTPRPRSERSSHPSGTLSVVAANTLVVVPSPERKDVFFCGRANDVIRTGGESVPATEVERVIKTHGDVRECAVFALPDEKFGEAVCPAVVLEGHRRASLLGIVIRRRTDDG